MRPRFIPEEYFSVPRVLLAPMAGYTDRVFRMLCFEEGCEGACSEMVSAKGLCFESGKTASLLEAGESEYPRGIQLFGSDPYYMGEAVRRLGDPEAGRFDWIDINCGCPARKIVSNGDGSALMADPVKAGRVIETVVKASPVPVSVKFRSGTDGEHLNYLAFAHVAAESGAAFLTVHGRTAEQQYSGTADWETVRAVKAGTRLPVIGNGDITDAGTALEKLAFSGCDALMIGRAALGDPFIFREIRAALDGQPYTPPTVEQRAEKALRHARLEAEAKGDRALVELRKHLPLYFNGLRGASAFRTRLSTLKTVPELEGVLLDIKESGTYNI